MRSFSRIGLIAVIILIGACASGGGGSGGNNLTVLPADPVIVTCEGCPDPAPGTWLWAQGSRVALLIDGLPVDNSAMDAWLGYAQVFICLRQWEAGYYKRSACHDFTGIKPGSYDSTYFVWGSLGEFCINDKWCSTGGPAYVELYVDDGINAPWSVFGIPDDPPPYI